MQIFARIVIGGIIGAAINAVGNLVAGLAIKVILNENSLASVAFIFLAGIIGGVFGALIGIFRPSPLVACLIATGVAILFLLFIFFGNYPDGEQLLRNKRFQLLWDEIILLVGIIVPFILSGWVVALTINKLKTQPENV